MSEAVSPAFMKIQRYGLRPLAILLIGLFVANCFAHWTAPHDFHAPYTWRPVSGAYPFEEEILDANGFQCAVLYESGLGVWTAQGPGFAISFKPRDEIVLAIKNQCH